MVHSMTAFARVEKAGTQGTLSWAQLGQPATSSPVMTGSLEVGR